MKFLRPPTLLIASVLCTQALAEPTYPDEPLPPDQVEQLVSPIALYPDPLVALILPASTFPSDVVLAARVLERGGQPSDTAREPWDESVRALARYPEVIDYLDDHLEWTRRLGQCFMDQPDDVMDAIQQVRLRAQAAGLLRDTPQQRIVIEEDEVCIVPANPQVIYVPRYDPWILYRPGITYYGRDAFITFGLGWSVGAWLSFDCDWRGRAVRVVNRPDHWYHAPRWSDRDRYRGYGFTTWTRRTPYSRHEGRPDRSPRVAGYVVPGGEHRNWSDPHRNDGRYDRDHRPGDNRRPGHDDFDRADGWQNRRRPEPNNLPRDLNPAGPAVIPPVALPAPEFPRPPQTDRRPDPRTTPFPDRVRPPKRPREENRPSPTRAGPPPTTSANRSSPPPPSNPPRAERPAPRPERNGDDQRGNSRRPERESGQDYQLR